MCPCHQVELTKHNLRLLIFEDVLHYHPDCKGLIQPTLDAATAATMPVPDGGSGAQSSSSSSSSSRPNSMRVSSSTSTPLPPPQASDPSALPPAAPSSTAAPTAIATDAAGADDDGSSHGESAWPPKEAAGPTAGLGAGPAAGWVGGGDAGDVDEATVMLAAVSVGGGAGSNGTKTNGDVGGPAAGAGLVTAV